MEKRSKPLEVKIKEFSADVGKRESGRSYITDFCLDVQKSQSQRFFLTFGQLNALVGMIFLATNSMVSVEDLAFIVNSLVYIHFLPKVAFPTFSPQPNLRIFWENTGFKVSM